MSKQLIVDFTKKSEVEVNLTAPNGENFTYKNVVSAQTLDLVTRYQQKLDTIADNIQLKKNGTTTIGLGGLYDLQAEMKAEILKSFFLDKYNDYQSLFNEVLIIANDLVYEHLETAIAELSKETYINANLKEESDEGK